MEEAAESRGAVRTAAFLAATIALVAASVWVARLVLFATFRAWDDEGYLILLARTYAEGGGLYDRIETPYGPLWFELLAGAHRFLGLPLDNVSARWIALVVWIGASLGCLALVRKATGSRLLALAAYVLCFPMLVALNGEPMHPSHAIVLFLPFLALAAMCGRFGTAGALVGAVLGLKLNVGAFLLLAFAGGFLRRSRIALLAIAGLPILLMRPRSSESWAQALMLIEVVAFAGFAAVRSDRRWSGRDLLRFVAGAAAVVVVVLAVALATGTSLAGLWDGLVVHTLRFPGSTFAEPDLPPQAAVIAALALVPVAAVLSRRRATASLAVLKTLAGAATVLLSLGPHGALTALPFLWILAMPIDQEDARQDRWILAYLVVLVSLQIYPVAGSQVNFFAFLLPAVALVGLNDASRFLPVRIHAASIAAGAAILAFAHPFYRALPGWSELSRKAIPLALPGAESIRLPEREVAVRHWLAANLRRNGSTFLGMPGLHSLYLWTEQEPPVPFYAHTWMITTPIERQETLSRAVAGRPDMCVVRNPELIRMWSHGEPPPPSPLVSAIERDFRVVARTGGYELLMRDDRAPNLVLSARRAESPPGTSDRFALRLSFPEIPGSRIARIAICDAARDRILFDTDSALTLTDPSGRQRSLPIDLDAGVDVLLNCPVEIGKQDLDDLLVRAYHSDGGVIARLPLVR